MTAAPEPLTDDELIRRYALGDAVAARTLVERHAPRLLAVARRMLGDAAEAEDVAQETMLRLWRGASAWRPGEAGVGTWLYRVASNLCLDRLRRRRPTGELSDDAPDDRPTAVATLARADRAAALDAALALLPERQRLAIVLRHFEERGNPEIAAALGVSVEAVESLLARGRRALAARLAPRRGELELDDGDT
ncbi:RNA polymerase sigma factor [Amaricoccus sp.]|uniref:RNA polymerase sigma factor n=1 Tax=Amaricoccus sp. TaxID=1872485 RepID=UPI001B4C0BAD|nr:RNA polymerase sigma factor [Amaricoccus sp.]MBP7243481.1 RNA polymerase sigma factor [Amaricoccus sp.]